MNKIIIVGHPHSGHEEVQRLLAECGMASPLPSRRENLTPVQISQTLLKVHGAVPVEQLQTAQQLQQIRVAPVWQGMVLDLMLANLDQTLWGWADTGAVYLLDYWKEQDPQVVFVLVYDTPETVFTRAPLEKAAASEEEFQRRIDAWVSYNAALLHFHLRNPGRSVLVHAAQVQASANSTLHHISAHIKAPLQLPFGLLAVAANGTQQETLAEADTIESLTAKLHTMQGSQFKKARKRLRAQLEALQASAPTAAEGPVAVQHHGVVVSAVDLPQCAEPGVFEQGHVGNDSLTELLARQLLQAHPEAMQLYEELQAAATLAHGMDVQPSTAVPALQLESSQASYQAWQALVQQRLQLQEQTRRARTQAEQIKLMQQQVQEAANESLEKQLYLQAQLQQTQECLKGQQQLTLQQKQASDAESQQLLAQLHQVQESLQSRTVQVQQQEKTLAELPKVKADLKAAQEKSFTLQAVGQENQMLLEQLHKVQEELESRYLQALQQEKTLAELPKVKADLLAAQDKANKLLPYQSQANKLQNELKVAQDKALQLQQSEELLKKQLQTELARVSAADLKALQEKAGKLQQVETTANKLKVDLLAAQDTAQKLQPYQSQASKLQTELKAAQDKASQLQQSEAQLKKQLQTERAKAPAADLQKENELLLSQLHKVQEELERYFIENSQYKASAKSNAQYGAADRVKQQLPYRLGASMIKKSGSVSGLLSMPWALRAEEKRIRAELAAHDCQLPPLVEYKDAHEAEYVQRHLSYRLGNTWVKRTQSLGGWITLPGALYAEVKAFRKERK